MCVSCKNLDVKTPLNNIHSYDRFDLTMETGSQDEIEDLSSRPPLPTGNNGHALNFEMKGQPYLRNRSSSQIDIQDDMLYSIKDRPLPIFLKVFEHAPVIF